MEWIYLSPHFDDVVFSCGGLLWEQRQKNEKCQVWTICAGEIPPGDLSPFAQELHQRWGTGFEAISERRWEDRQACMQLGASIRHFPVPDCIYRRDGENYWDEIPDLKKAHRKPAGHLYASNEAIFGSIHPAETDLIHLICELLSETLPEAVELVCPMAIGGHVDHRLTRAAAELLDRPLWYYPDFPYVANNPSLLEEFDRELWKRSQFSISQAGLNAWVEAVTAYRTQFSTFWCDLESLQKSLENYLKWSGGLRLFRWFPIIQSP